MEKSAHIINSTMELSDCKSEWFFDERFNCWCLEDVLYTPKATTPLFQRMSIFVPAAYMTAPGEINYDAEINGYTAKSVPVIFENNSAGYKQMPHVWLGGPRCYAEQYLNHGFVYISCGNRGVESTDENGNSCGKSPINLIDLKMAIRFLRHNKDSIPGDLDRIISVGWSAGGAMSSLLGVTGDSHNYDEYLEENGAFMDERDDVFAAQIYCPIIDLENADLAYEWLFGADKENEQCATAPAGTMTPFVEALSRKLSAAYIEYFNGRKFKNPNGEGFLVINEDGRSGSGYDYLMEKLNRSATKYLTKLSKGELDEKYSPEDYIAGNYTYMGKGPMQHREHNAAAHHAGQEVELPRNQRMSLGEMMLRPETPEEENRPHHGSTLVELHGKDKSAWLKWDGERAEISSLDDYVLNHRGRMKPCTSFDTLNCASSENEVMAAMDKDATHFNSYMSGIIESLKDEFPEEYKLYHEGYDAVDGDEGVKKRRYLINPMNYVATGENSTLAEHFRIRVGASDADTSFTISMNLALKLMEAGKDTDYELVWEKPHSEADYEGEVVEWIDRICK